MRKTTVSIFCSILFTLFAASAVAAQQKFIVALNAAQEVPATNSAGRGACIVTLNLSETQITVACQYAGLSGNVTAAQIHGGAAPGANAPVLFNLNFTGGASGTINSAPINVTPAQVADLRAQRFYINLVTAGFPSGEVRGQIKNRFTAHHDFDGDGRDDPIMTRTANNVQTTYILNSLNNQATAKQLGQTGDVPFAVDFDNDGIADPVRLRINPTTGEETVLVLLSSTNTVFSQVVGNFALGDAPSVGDYDGDGRADIAIFRRTSGLWTIVQSSTGTARTEFFGAAGDFAAPGDYDKDGKHDLAVTRSVGGQKFWYIKPSSGSGGFYGFPFGLATDSTYFFLPMIDVDGDGASDQLVTREENGQLVHYARRSSNGSLYAVRWGLASDFISFGDYDGDGKSEPYAIRNINNQRVWFVQRSSTNSLQVFYWGLPGDEHN